MRGALLALGCAVVLGCARYRPAPLDATSPLAADLPALLAPAARRDSAAAPVAGALGLDAVAALAVRHNPRLVAQRRRLDVAEAQVFAAGLLPDPQISASLDLPFHDQPDLVTAWGAGLSYDLVALLTRPARRTAEQRHVEQVRLDLVWQEWQVAQQTRLAAIRVLAERRRLALLRSMLALYDDRYRRSSRALADGNLTLDVNGTDLTAVLDTVSQVAQSEKSLAQARLDLNRLIGLAPEARLPLAAMPSCAAMDAAAIAAALRDMPERRPDLRALRAGYASQESRVKAAILAQFPTITLGPSAARDTGDVTTAGVAATLELPIFSGNRGAVARARATRSVLAAEYRARIAQAETDVATVAAQQAVVARQQARLRRHLPVLEKLVAHGRSAYADGDIGALTFLNLEQTFTRSRLESIALDQATCENRVALEVLLAAHSDDDEVIAP